mmetsp:Transcript_32960/g.72294  ORF Transcript_32960/g.72294 Transcript_32960/m.72294 type:complete len:228 (+) Transcript_32960:913-1596(+)
MATTRVTHLGKDLSHPNGDSGFTSSRSTGEGHVQRGDGGLEAKLTTHLVKNKKGSNLLNTLLDRDKTNKVVVKLVKLILDTLLEHELIDGTSGLTVRHIAHVGNLLETLLTLDLSGTFAVRGLLLVLSALYVGLVQLVTETAIVGSRILRLGFFIVLDRFSAEGVLRRLTSRTLFVEACEVLPGVVKIAKLRWLVEKSSGCPTNRGGVESRHRSEADSGDGCGELHG